jgi:four helix bundle protein
MLNAQFTMLKEVNMAAVEKIEDRTYNFSLRIIRLARALPKDYASRVIGQQVLRSGTSVGANVEEAVGSITKREFANKMAIAYKEARETHYWLRLIRDSEMVSARRIEPLIREALEIKRSSPKRSQRLARISANPSSGCKHSCCDSCA